MTWPAIDRTKPVTDPDAPAVFDEPLRKKILSFLSRYETKRAALLPALHVVQNTHGQITWQAMKEVAELLDLSPAEVLDTVSFYTHFWIGKRGRKVIVVCRSLSCQVLGAGPLLEAVKQYLGIEEHQTTPDGEWSLMTEECLGACEHGPCMLIGEKLHSRVKPEDVPRILADPNCSRIDVVRSNLLDPPGETVVDVPSSDADS